MFGFVRLIAGLLLLSTVLAGAAGGALYWYGGRDLPDGIDRVVETKDGKTTSYAGEFEGFSHASLSTGILSSSVVKQEGRRVAVLARDHAYISYTFENGLPDKAQIVVVPRYFVTDFASIPWPASYLISPFGDHAEAAVIHDWLYALGTDTDPDDPDYKEDWDRDKLYADIMFYNAMRESGVPKWRRRVMFGAVRFGGHAFGSDREWFGKPCSGSFDECEDRSRFFEPFVGTYLPDACLPMRDRKNFTPLGQVSGRGIEIQDGDDGDFPLFKTMTAHVDSLWREALSTEACTEFMQVKIEDEQTFVAIKDPRIEMREGEDVVVLASTAERMVSAQPRRLALPLTPAEMAALDAAVQGRLVGPIRGRDPNRWPDESDAELHQRETGQILFMLGENEAAKGAELIKLYDEIEARGQAALASLPPALVAKYSFTAADMTWRTRAAFFGRLQSYTSVWNNGEQLTDAAIDRYFDLPITYDMYKEGYEAEAQALYDEIEGALP